MTIADVVPSETEGWDALIRPSEPVATVDMSNTTIPSDSDEMGCSL
jgi:branched-chain amino acid transport system substrate-binding protein